MAHSGSGCTADTVLPGTRHRYCCAAKGNTLAGSCVGTLSKIFAGLYCGSPAFFLHDACCGSACFLEGIFPVHIAPGISTPVNASSPAFCCSTAAGRGSFSALNGTLQEGVMVMKVFYGQTICNVIVYKNDIVITAAVF